MLEMLFHIPLAEGVPPKRSWHWGVGGVPSLGCSVHTLGCAGLCHHGSSCPLSLQRERHPGPGVAVHGPYGVSNQRSSSSTG